MVHYAIPAKIVDAIDLMSVGPAVGLSGADPTTGDTSATAEMLPVTPAEA
jgi:hypothetical protein